jgi:hypothetical protein
MVSFATYSYFPSSDSWPSRRSKALHHVLLLNILAWSQILAARWPTWILRSLVGGMVVVMAVGAI